MNFQTLRAGAWLLVLSSALSACTGENQSGMSNVDRASARASVDIIRDCDKPWFDTVSASDHVTVVKGMSPIEREVCSEQLRPGSSTGSR